MKGLHSVLVDETTAAAKLVVLTHAKKQVVLKRVGAPTAFITAKTHS